MGKSKVSRVAGSRPRSKCRAGKSQKSKHQAGTKKSVLIFLTVLLCFVAGNLFAQPISSTELINNAKQYNGKTVIYMGEVIGDVMRRGQYAWINVNDGSNAIGVWVPTDMTRSVLFTGNYKTKGDLVEISGIFQRSCPEHGGDLDIHAQALRKISSGYQTAENVNFYKTRLTITLALIAGLVWILSLLNKQ